MLTDVPLDATQSRALDNRRHHDYEAARFTVARAAEVVATAEQFVDAIGELYA